MYYNCNGHHIEIDFKLKVQVDSLRDHFNIPEEHIEPFLHDPDGLRGEIVNYVKSKLTMDNYELDLEYYDYADIHMEVVELNDLQGQD